MGMLSTLVRAGCTAALTLLALPALAQADAGFPSKPVRIVISFVPGGAGDFLARQVQQRLQAQEKYRHGVIVDNKPGASGTIGADTVLRAPADGHTILVTNQLLVQAPHLLKSVPYDPLRDFTPVTDLGGAPIILAVNTALVQAKTLPDFVAEVRAKRNTYSYASVGIASMGHLYGAQLKDVAGIDLLHVPYKGSAAVVGALVGGEVQSAFSDYPTMKPHIESGKLRMLAVSRPYAPTPNLPTFASQGYQGLESYSWIGMFVPARTPRAVVQQLAADVTAAIRSPEVQAKLQEVGMESGGMPPAKFAEMVAADSVRWGEIMKKAQIKPE
jgi:tripartite-type tricarboxylate transporter receptor subunit TctC